MLIVLGGLPGSGKSTIAREIVAQWPAVYLRIDAIEQAIRSANVLGGAGIGPAGYAVAYALAKSNLALGLSVIADAVNPLPITREAWRAVAAGSTAGLLEVEIVCSDPTEHRRRVESRQSDIDGHVLPDWASVLQHDYVPWTTPRLVVDSAVLSARDAASLILRSARAAGV